MGNMSRILFILFLVVGCMRAAEINAQLTNTKIAFTSERDGNAEIYVMNADGTNQINLTNHLAGDGDPSWSPDGARIAFASNRTGIAQVYLMNVDGSNVVMLTNELAGASDPSWSRDGTRIAFVIGDSETAEIYVMNADGT